MICKKSYQREIERKFLLKHNYPSFSKGTYIEQGYLFYGKDREIRLRMKEDVWSLTIKIGGESIIREEYEYAIPATDGSRLLKHCAPGFLIKKRRYRYKVGNYLWEIDFFEGDNKGLVLAEIELESELSEVEKPDWIGREVTGELRYYNINIFQNPYKNWDIKD